MTRFRAFSYHFLISLVVFFAISYVVFFHWFPGFFFAIDGGWEGMRIIIGVDLILGPVLTLIVFKHGKPGLKFDLWVIALLQSTCLLAGLYIIYSERPIFFIYYDKHFYSSSADTFTDYGVPAPDPREFSDDLPAMVFSKLPGDPIEEADMRQILYQDSIPAWVHKPTYQPLFEHFDQVLADAAPESALRARDENDQLDKWLSENHGQFSDFAFIPIHSRYRDAYLGIRKSDRSFINIIEIPPPL